ncbi:MAG: hypothetical protein ACYC35_00015 [Pirellulales bacterium]
MDEKAKLISEYERLRRVHHSLWVQLDTVDSRLCAIEDKLPDEYTFPGDPPLIEQLPDDPPTSLVGPSPSG